MKKSYFKILALVLALVLTFSFVLTGCGEDTENTKNPDSSQGDTNKDDGKEENKGETGDKEESKPGETATEAPIESGIEVAEKDPKDYLSQAADKTTESLGGETGESSFDISKGGSVAVSFANDDIGSIDGKLYINEEALALILNGELGGQKLDASAWLNDDGIIFESEALKADAAQITVEAIESFIESLQGAVEEVKPVGTGISTLAANSIISENIPEFTFNILEYIDDVKAEETTVDGKSAVKLTMNIDNAALIKILEAFVDENKESLEAVCELLTTMGNDVSYRDLIDGVDEFVGLLKDGSGTIDADIEVVVLDETKCIESIEIDCDITDNEENETGNLLFVLNNEEISLKLTDDESTTEVALKIADSADEYKLQFYVDAEQTYDGEKYSSYSALTLTYDKKDGKYFISASEKYDDEPTTTVFSANGVAKLTDDELVLSLEKISSLGYDDTMNDVELNLTLKIKANDKMPEAPKASVVINDMDALGQYVESLDRTALEGLFGSEDEYGPEEEYEDWYDDEYEDVYDDDYDDLYDDDYDDIYDDDYDDLYDDLYDDVYDDELEDAYDFN